MSQQPFSMKGVLVLLIARTNYLNFPPHHSDIIWDGSLHVDALGIINGQKWQEQYSGREVPRSSLEDGLMQSHPRLKS